MLKNFEQLKEMLRAKPGTRRVAVAVAQDEHTLQAVAHAANDGLVQPVLIGKADEIKAILEKSALMPPRPRSSTLRTPSSAFRRPPTSPATGRPTAS